MGCEPDRRMEEMSKSHSAVLPRLVYHPIVGP